MNKLDITESDNIVSTATGYSADLLNFPIECYGQTTVLSVTEGPEEERVYPNYWTSSPETGGKTYRIKPWKVTMPSTPDAVLRNLQAIAPGKEAFWYEDKIAMQRKLYRVKSTVLFQHSWQTKHDICDLPGEVTENFTQIDWNAGTYEVEFRTVPEDEPIPLHSPFKQQGMVYKGKRIIANIVFRVVNKEGRVCKFDIAGLNNPETLIGKKKAIKNKCTARINNPKTTEATRQKLADILMSVDSSSQAYANWFSDMVDKFEREGAFSVDVSNAVRHPMRTNFRKRPVGNDGKVSKIRMGGRGNPDHIDAPSDLQNLKDTHPDIVFSRIYTYSGYEADWIKLNPSLRGKAFVLVTSDMLMKPDELLAQYISQQYDQTEGAPVVRMMVLDNYGVSFSQLNDPKFMGTFQPRYSGKKLFQPCFMGLTMFTSLWNARAALIKFNQALDKWKTDSHYSDAQLRALLSAQDMQCRNPTDSKTAAELQSEGLTAADIDNLNRLNDEVLLDIPMFRLGYSDNGKGFYIQRYNIEGSKAYDSGQKEANLCAITPEKAMQFQKMVNAVIQIICPSPWTDNPARFYSLNLGLTHKNEKGEKVDWQPDEFIDFIEAKRRRTLSGLLLKQGDMFYIDDPEGNNLLAEPEGNYWSEVQNLILKYVRTITDYQHHPYDYSQIDSYVEFSFKENCIERTEHSLGIPIDEFFGKNALLKPAVDGRIDSSLMDMCNLIFHGTVDDIHRSVDAQHPLIQMDDAYFKQGFFINLELDINAIKGDRYEYNRKILFYPVGSCEELFTVGREPQPAGLQLSLPALLGIPQKSISSVEEAPTIETEPKETPEQILRRTNPAGAELIDHMNKYGYNFAYEDWNIEEAAHAYNKFGRNYGWYHLDLYSLESGDVYEALRARVAFRDNKFVTWEEQLMSDYHVSKIEIELGRYLIITTTDGKVLIGESQTRSFKQVTLRSTYTTISRFEEKYKDNTVEWAVFRLLDSKSFQESIKGPDFYVSEEQLNRFERDLYNAIALGKELTISEAPLALALDDIINNYDYVDILIAMMDEDEDLFSAIFEVC